MTAGENVPFSVIPAKAGIQGVGPDDLVQQTVKVRAIQYLMPEALRHLLPDGFITPRWKI